MHDSHGKAEALVRTALVDELVGGPFLEGLVHLRRWSERLTNTYAR
jgi:hypothetical protein